MSDATPHTDDGLSDLGNDDFITIAKKNLTYILETQLQQNGVDPSFSSRTNAINRLVHLSFPKHKQTVYPVIIVKDSSVGGSLLGNKGGHAQPFINFTIRIEAIKEFNLSRLFAKLISVVTSETILDQLIQYDMNPDPENYILNVTSLLQDPAREYRYYYEVTLRFFTLIQNS